LRFSASSESENDKSQDQESSNNNNKKKKKKKKKEKEKEDKKKDKKQKKQKKSKLRKNENVEEKEDKKEEGKRGGGGEKSKEEWVREALKERIVEFLRGTPEAKAITDFHRSFRDGRLLAALLQTQSPVALPPSELALSNDKLPAEQKDKKASLLKRVLRVFHRKWDVPKLIGAFLSVGLLIALWQLRPRSHAVRGQTPSTYRGQTRLRRRNVS